MSEFKNKSITSKGLELLSKALAGEQLTFTKIEMGSGLCEGDTGEATVLVQPQQILPITKISRKGGQVTLSAALKIEDITNSFDWTEIGVYAKGNDGVEVLYMYGYTQNSSFISKESLNEKLVNVTVMVSNATNITATIDNSLVYLTAEALKDHEKDISTHQDIRDEVIALGEQLGQLDISWESIEGKPESFPAEPHDHFTVVQTSFNDDGSLTESINSLDGQSYERHTEFLANGDIKETITKGKQQYIKTTQFRDNTIIETLEQKEINQ